MASRLTSFETREADEDKLATHILEVFRRRQEKSYAPGGTLRAAHPKSTGLVQAVFAVEPNLPAALRVGAFAEPRAYDAWVRFSNANGAPQSDAKPDVRGVAIKLHDAPGPRIPESDEPTTQDFILLSMPTMPLGSVKLFHDAVYLNIEKTPLHFLAKMLLTGHARALKALLAGASRPSSPADIRYWSTTPYLFGPDRVAKYSLTPTSAYKSALPAKPSADYLGENLQKHLSEADATFDFHVQLRTDPASMPVEDAAVEWSEALAPFAKVATLRIPKQEFRTKEREALSEALAFSPAHALEAHRPIGAVNRARIRIYAEQAAFRRERDRRSRAV